MKQAVVIAMMLVLLLGAAPLRAAGEPYDFYAILSLTGPAAFLGQSEAPTLHALENYWNARGGIGGRPLHVIVQDDQSNAAVAVQLANQVVAKHPAAFVGPGFGATCAAVNPLVQNTGPVMYCLSTNINPPAGSYSFLVLVKNKDQTGNGLRYLKAEGVKTVAVLASTDTSGVENANGAIEALKDPDLRDLKLVADERFAAGDLSITAQLERIKASGAQALLVMTTGTPFGLVLKSVSESGYKGIVLTGAGNTIKAQLQQYASFYPSKVVFTAAPFQLETGISQSVLAARKVFAGAMKTVGVDSPNVPNSIPWDPMMMMIEGLRKLGPEASATQLRDYLLGIHGFVGVYGTYDFRRGDQRGLDPRSTGVVRFDQASGDFVQLSAPGGKPL